MNDRDLIKSVLRGSYRKEGQEEEVAQDVEIFWHEDKSPRNSGWWLRFTYPNGEKADDYFMSMNIPDETDEELKSEVGAELEDRGLVSPPWDEITIDRSGLEVAMSQGLYNETSKGEELKSVIDSFWDSSILNFLTQLREIGIDEDTVTGFTGALSGLISDLERKIVD
jgi:hypothetical protein